ncbi:ribonuclease H-like domain, reverse transcriptase, RNA-dependent DNA polymerase [Tanacetum coccineum]
MLACFLSQEEPKTISQSLEDERWVEAMQEELLQFKLQKVWILVDLPFRKKAIGTKWVFRNKRDERSIVVKNKARLVAQVFRQEEGINYDEVFALVARIEAIRLFLAFASFMGFLVCQMDVKSAFLYGTIEEEVYVHQPPGFVDPAHPNKVYKVKQQPDEIFISQDKYVADILKKFDFCSIKTATTPIVSNKPLVKDEDGVDVDVHIYKSMIGSLMYLTASRPDIMFVVCACARFQVTPKASHLNVVKRIFRYLKHQPKLGLWYPRDSPFKLKAFSDSDYGGASLDRKSTTGGCQFLGRRLISWQCKKQTIVANSTTKAEYVKAANYCGQANLMLPGKFGAARQIWCCQANLVLPGKSSMANLEFVDQHNMVACLEKTERNSDFHEIVDFLASSSIHHALTISPPIYTSYIKQFWNTASSQKVNDVKQINTIVDSKAVVVIEASIRSSLLFNDADGIACLTNEAIFQNLALIAEGKGSGEPTEPQPIPSPTQPSTGDQPPETSTGHATTQDSRNSLEGTNGNEGDQVQPPYDSPLLGGHTSDRAEGALNLQELSVLCTNLSNRVLALESIKDAQAAEISALKIRIEKLEKKCKLRISHHKAWLKSMQRLSMKKRFGKKEYVSKQGRKNSKLESTLDDSTVFDDQDTDHGMEYMDTEEAVDEGRQSGETEEVKLTDDTEVC